MSTTTKIDTDNRFEKLRKLAGEDRLDAELAPPHYDHASANAWVSGVDSGYRSRDAEVAGYQSRAYLEEGAAQKLREEILRRTHDQAAKDAEIAELVEALGDVLSETVNESAYPDGPCLRKELRDEIRVLLAKHGKESV